MKRWNWATMPVWGRQSSIWTNAVRQTPSWLDSWTEPKRDSSISQIINSYFCLLFLFMEEDGEYSSPVSVPALRCDPIFCPPSSTPHLLPLLVVWHPGDALSTAYQWCDREGAAIAIHKLASPNLEERTHGRTTHCLAQSQRGFPNFSFAIDVHIQDR